jgi:predicted ATPase
MKVFLPFRLDIVNQCLWHRREAGDDERVLLAPKAFDVLRYLVEHAGRLVTHGELLQSLWPDTCVEPQAVKQHVFEVRRVLGDASKEPRFIETVPRRGYRFIAAVSDGRRFPNTTAPARQRMEPLVGREWALEELRECLRKVMRDQRQIVFVTGEPGIGKTALVDEFQHLAAAEIDGLRIARGQCVEGFGGREPYYPMLEALSQLARGTAGQAFVQTLAAPAPTWLAQFPTLMSREHREVLQHEIVGSTRARMLREISEALEAITAETPLLLVFEDVQWADHATVDLISVLARRREPAKLLLVATKRVECIECDDHPLKIVKHELLMHGLCREIALAPLAETEVAEYLGAQTSGSDLPRELSAIVHRHSEGNPLFMVAALEHMTKRGLIDQGTGSWQLCVPLEEIDLEVPDNLGQMIEARVGRLSQEEQRVLEAASITGTIFSPSVNAAGTNLGPDAFEDLCETLSRRHGIVRPIGAQQFPDGTFSSRYEFVHALYGEVLYLRQAPGRRATLHRRIGERLEKLFADRADEVAPELARHFEEGFDYVRAAKYQRLAAEAASRRDAHLETATRLQYALELLSRPLPKLAAQGAESSAEQASDLPRVSTTI